MSERCHLDVARRVRDSGGQHLSLRSGARILRQEGHALGIDRNFTILDEGDRDHDFAA